eukprot:6008413-Prorocentrum_lima.AAC.1
MCRACMYVPCVQVCAVRACMCRSRLGTGRAGRPSPVKKFMMPCLDACGLHVSNGTAGLLGLIALT